MVEKGPQDARVASLPPGPGDPEVPCHCDQQPDRTSDEALAIPQDTAAPRVDNLLFSLAQGMPARQVDSAAVRTHSRGPPAFTVSPAQKRKLLCVFLV